MTGTKTQNNAVRNLVMAGLCLAMCLLLPFLTGQIPEIGSRLSPMHFPVLLCGYLCGWPYALAVGFAAPLLRSLLFGMPPLVPAAIVMAFELAAYGLATAILSRLLPKKPGFLYVSLILSMLLGRVVWGFASLVVYNLLGNPFTWQMFVAGAFLNAIPGIIVQIVLIPPIVLGLRRAGLAEGGRTPSPA